jgi:hypothetical protein
MMTDTNPRHSVKARRKQKEDTDQNFVDTNVNIGDADDPDAWRRKYEAAVRKRRSPVASVGSGFGGGLAGNLSPSSPLSVKSSAANSLTLSQADMEFILATSMDTLDRMDGSEPQQPSMIDYSNSNYSADSIIRRVEAEIAAARKSAAMAHSNHQNRMMNRHDTNGDEEEDDDMAQILNTNNTFSEQHQTASVASSADSSKRRALDLIRDEFRENLVEKGVELFIDRSQEAPNNGKSISPQQPPSSKLFFTDEDWQNAPGIKQTSPLFQTEKNDEEEDSSSVHPSEEKKEDKPSPSSNRMVRLSASPKDSPKKRTNTVLEQPVPVAPDLADTNCDDLGTPTRSNGRRIARISVVDQLQTLPPPVSNINKDPDGDYQETATPPRKQLAPATTSQQLSSVASPPSNSQNKVPFTARLSQRRSPAMNKTRELLDSLKEQRQSIPSPNEDGKLTVRSLLPKSPIDEPPPSPRSPTIFFTRAANKAKDHVKVTQSSIAHSRPYEPESNETVKAVDRSYPPSSPGRSISSRNQQNETLQPKRRVFPDEVYELAKNDEAGKGTVDSGSVTSEQSRRIRFRNPFPVLKPPTVRRDIDEIIRDHAMDIPEMQIRLVKPKQELKQLIVAAMGTSLPRRSNACGALKVLTRHEKNQLSLVRTDGFLQALTYAASQSVLDVDTDLAIDARTRAVTCLKNVCGPKDNRVLILNHPGVVECLLKVVQQDDGAGRAMAAAAIALLAKTPSCRECLVQVEELIDTLANVMRSAATMISEEAMAVRQSFSPRSGGYSNHRKMNNATKSNDDNGIQLDQSLKPNESENLNHHGETASIVTDSSSLSSVEGEHSVGEPSAMSPADIVNNSSKLVEVRTVDSIRNQTEDRYDEFVNQARCNSCAALLHISKQCASSVRRRETKKKFLLLINIVCIKLSHFISSRCVSYASARTCYE